LGVNLLNKSEFYPKVEIERKCGVNLVDFKSRIDSQKAYSFQSEDKDKSKREDKGWTRTW